MEKQSAKGGLALFTILLVLLTAPLQRVEAMNAILTNNMSQEVGITCMLEGTIPDESASRIIFPGKTYFFQIGNGGTDFTGVKYTCVFATAGKPRTILEVFAGTGGPGNVPCNCVGGVCPWSVTNDGFSCNGYHHGWGS